MRFRKRTRNYNGNRRPKRSFRSRFLMRPKLEKATIFGLPILLIAAVAVVFLTPLKDKIFKKNV